MPRYPVDGPDDERIAEFVGLREGALRRGRRPGDPSRPLVDHGDDGGDGSRGGGTGDSDGGDGSRGGGDGGAGDGGGDGGGPDRPGAGVFVAEGDVVVERALRAGYRLRAVLVDAGRTEPLPAALPEDAVVYEAAPPVITRITGLPVHRGVLASFDRRRPPRAAEVLADARRIVVLEAVTNPTNLGTILRSARGLGMDAALLDPRCTDPLYRRASRVAMGESYGFPWAWLPAFPEGLEPVRAAGFRLVALTPDADAVPLDRLEVAPDDRVALLLGAEGPGLAPATLAAAEVRAGIPMHHGVDSLNVGVAAGVACWVLGHVAGRPG